ncbi:MAG TPA: HAMP domain-containing sensor histidine kinase, partial [Archangium sp.]
DASTAPLLSESGVDAEFLLTELPSAVEQACEGIQRVAELVRGMKEFAHHDGGEVTLTDLNEALERTLVVSKNEWKYVAQIETALGAVPRVPCTASSMRQVFLNLICNAAYAVADQNKRTGRGRGTIRVSTRLEGEWVVVSVADDGTGIPEGARHRIFEPFFTTKPVGRGTGQGLAISNTIVTEKNGGKLTFDTEVGLGTTFHVWLPLRGPAR